MIKIKPVPAALTPAVYQIHKDFFAAGSPDFLSLKSFNDLVAAPETRLLCAFEADKPAGYALFRLMADEAELLSIAVKPTKRRCGIGHALLARMEEQLKEAGCQFLYLEVNETNDVAIHAYRAAGFHNIGERKAYYRAKNGEHQSAVLMKKPLC